MEKVPILKRFGFSIFITCINIALLIFIYSVYQRNAKLSQNVPTVDHGKPLFYLAALFLTEFLLKSRQAIDLAENLLNQALRKEKIQFSLT